MFEGWENCFLMLGGAAGALIGLLFVVVGLTSSHDREAHLRGASLYLTPVVFHFAVVVVISAVALAPNLRPTHLAALVGACALVGVVHLSFVIRAMIACKKPAPPHWSDIWCYGVIPLVLYLALGGAAAAAQQKLVWAPYAIAGVALALLLVGIRNAWDLVTWLAPAGALPAAGPAAEDS